MGGKWLISSSVMWILSINSLKMQTTQCQLEYIASTSVLPASASMPESAAVGLLWFSMLATPTSQERKEGLADYTRIIVELLRIIGQF